MMMKRNTKIAPHPFALQQFKVGYAIEAYARTHEMSFRETLGFLASRSSVDISLELLGLHAATDFRVALVTELEKHGYPFRKMYREKSVV